MSTARKRLLALLRKQLAPVMQRAVSNPTIPGNLRLRFVARSHQLDRFLLKFSRKGSLLLLHDPFPFCGESTLSSLLPPLLWVKTTLVMWSKVVESIADRAGVPRFTTHTPRHLRLTHLARAHLDLHQIATYAGHKSLQT